MDNLPGVERRRGRRTAREGVGKFYSADSTVQELLTGIRPEVDVRHTDAFAEGVWDGASFERLRSISERTPVYSTSPTKQDDGDRRKADEMNARTASLPPRGIGEHVAWNVHSLELPQLYLISTEAG
jgi:hypothetical protein